MWLQTNRRETFKNRAADALENASDTLRDSDIELSDVIRKVPVARFVVGGILLTFAGMYLASQRRMRRRLLRRSRRLSQRVADGIRSYREATV